MTKLDEPEAELALSVLRAEGRAAPSSSAKQRVGERLSLSIAGPLLPELGASDPGSSGAPLPGSSGAPLPGPIVKGFWSGASAKIAVVSAVGLSAAALSGAEAWRPQADVSLRPGTALRAVASSRWSELPRAEPAGPVEPPAVVETPAETAPPARVRVQPVPDRAPSLAEQQTLLDLARRAVAQGDGETALSHLDAHSRRYPASTFEEEREALRVKALAVSGRKAEARRLARSFERRFPHSLLSAAVRSSVDFGDGSSRADPSEGGR